MAEFKKAQDNIAKKMPDLFMSYSRKDKDFVRRLDESLKSRGREAWVDWEDIRPTEDFMQAIYGAIEGADTFVFVHTPDSVASVVCGREIAHAVAHNKRMVPVVARDVNADTVHEALAKLNWIFFRDSDDFEKATDTLISAFDTDLEWVHAHTRLLTRAIEWENKGKNNSFVLRGDDLRAAEQWLAQAGTEKERQPTALQTEYIIASRKAASRRQRIISGAVSLALIVSIILTIVAFAQRQQAVVQRKLADERRIEAERQARIALSRELAAAATHSSDSSEAELRVILAREAVATTYSVDRTVTAEAAEILRKSVPPEPIALQFGHKEAISSLAFSPDGKRLATGDEKIVKIWDISSRDEMLITSEAYELDRSRQRSLDDFERQSSQSRLLAWSDDGGRLVSVGGDKAKVWDSHSGRELALSRTDEDSIRDVRQKQMSWGFDVRLDRDPEKEASSLDGKWLAIISDTSVKVKDVSTGRELRTVTHGVDRIRAAGFSPDGKRLVTISGEIGKSSAMRIWDIAGASPTPIAQSDSADTIVRIVFSPDLNRVAIASEKREWGRGNSIYAGRSSVKVIDVPSNSEVFRLPDQNKPISVAFSPDGTRLVTASDEKVQLWDASGHDAGTFAGRYFAVFSRDGKSLASPGENGTATVWEISSGKQLTLPGQNKINLDGVAFSPDGTRLATAGSDNRLRVWDTSSARTLLNIVSGQDGTIGVLVYSADGKRFATGSAHGVARVFDATSGSAIRQLPGNAGIDSAALSPDGTRLIIGYRSKDPETAKVWELSSDQSPRALVRDDPVSGLAFSPDGKRAVTSGFVAPGHAAVPGKVWDVTSSIGPFKELFSLSQSTYHGLIAYSPDGKQIATCRRIWDAATGTPLFAIPEAEGRSWRFAFSRDAKRFAIVMDQAVGVWDLASQKVPFTLDKPLTIDNGTAIRSLTFTSDGKFLATISDDWTMRLHPLGIEDLMTLARQRVPRELSADERRNYLHTK